MKFLWINLICVLLITLNRIDRVLTTRDHDYPNVIELVGYNSNPAGGNRRSRMSRFNPSDDSEQQMRQYRQYSSLLVTPSSNKEQADIETVKTNIDEYNKLLKLDTKKLNDQQKDMLERIVERVARLKESYDIDADDQSTNVSKDEDHIELKKTTLSTDDTITTIQSTTSIPTTVSTTSETIVSQARSANDNNKSTSSSSSNNNKNSSTRNNNTSNKSRVRQHSTKRPSSSTKTTAKRTTGHRQPTKASTASHTMSSTISTLSTIVPISSNSASATTNNSNNNNNNNSNNTMNIGPNVGNMNAGQQQKVIPATTIQPRVKSALSQQSYGQQQDQLHDVLIKQQNHHLQHHHYHSASDDLAMEQKTMPNVGYGGQSSLIYDTNVTTSSIIDSLANHGNRDEYYTRGPHTEANKEKKTTATMKPTKYHFYPHNQHIYLLPECAIQQVCNAVYVRLNYTQPLCACPSRYRDPCSASLSEDDEHTTKLVGDISKKAITLAKTCESTTEMRECRTPKDWSLLALQNTRTGKSHYLVICRCPAHFKLEGPMAHDQPTYASVPGIRVFGMMCVKPGYSVRKPSVQPPKRYQLQKPYYVPSSNKYGSIKDSNRPSYGQQDSSYQNQYQANYQYLSRPDNTPILTSNTEYPDQIPLNTFGGVYGRNNERKGENVAAEDETTAAATDNNTTVNSNTNTNTNNNNNNNNSNSSNSSNNSSNNNNKENSKREKRDVTNEDYAVDDDDVPEFPWHRLEELRRSVLWD